MKPAIDIALRRSTTEATQRARTACGHVLPGAAVRHWATPQWHFLEQGYDLPDVYVSYLEITAGKDATIPIRCPLHDLYGFYVLEGDVRITAANETAPVLHTAGGHYRLSYLPAAAYRCHFRRGTHRIFYFVAKDSVLFREPSPELEGGIAPVEALRAKLGAPAVSTSLPLAGAAGDAIGHFLRHPGTTYLRRYFSIHTLVIALLSEACHKLYIKSAARQVGEAFAERMRDYIDELVVDGEDVSAASVALHFQVSYAYAKTVFKAHAGQPIGGYIRRRKLEQACLLLKAGEPPVQVARYICWSYSHFNKAFKARYGVSPRSAVQSGTPIVPPAGPDAENAGGRIQVQAHG